MTSLTGMHRAFQKFQSLLTREPLRVSFQEWRMATMRLKLQSKPELSEDDQEFIVELIASQQNNLEWTYGRLDNFNPSGYRNFLLLLAEF